MKPSALSSVLGVLIFGSLNSVFVSEAVAQKIATPALTGRVLQVVPEGLLFSAGSTTYLLIGHPKQASMAEGDPVNCYAERIEQTYTYTDVMGSRRTVRVYRYRNERIGKR